MSSMMKISLVLRDITERGGGERVCVNLANALSEKHEVQILSFYQSHQELSYALHPRVKLQFLSFKGEKSGGKLFAFFRRVFYRYVLSFKAIALLKKSEIILANDRALTPFVRKNKKYIRLWHLNFRKKSFALFDALVVPSSKEVKQWKTLHSNVWVIPNFLPFDTKERTQYHQKNILSVGRMDRGDQKGFLRLVEIFSKIAPKYPDWTLTLVGEGKLRVEIEEKIKIFNLSKQIILKPFIQSISQEYLKASFYVMASHFEGFGMVLAESALYGLASVAFDIASGPSDLITDCQSGFLIQDGDLDEFACKMEALIVSERMREEMGGKAKAKMQKEFLQDAVLLQWEALFSSLQSHNL